MKATGIISALIFAHAAFAQATDTSSASVSAAASTPNAALNTPSVSAAASPSSASASAYGSESSSASSSGTKKGSKPSSAAASSVAPTPSTPDAYAGATGTQALPLEASQAASGNANPFIPSDVSPGCATYLNALNSDSAISSCLNSLLTTLAPFTGGANPPASQVPKALGALCGSTACSISTMQSKLVEFATACSDELTGSNPNQEVVTRYDTMYAVIPFKSAICTKDVDTQTYCVLNPSKGSNSTGSSNLAVTGPSEAVTYARDHLSTSHASRKRAQTVLVPNVETYRNSGLMYLFATPDMNAGELCTSCTSQVLSKYFAFQNTVHYALGAKNSPLLGGQSDLWSAIQGKCPSDFASEVRNSAGVASADQLSGASPAFATSVISAFAGALAAVVALV